jgi:hypothetical protein
VTPLSLHLDAVAFRGPGLDGWDALARAFQGDGRLAADEGPALPDCLAPRAARRVSPQIRLALSVAERIAPALPKEAAWVFASAAGESETLKVILEALREPGMMIQPLRFQNAVHNAASGQWSIAAGATGPVTSLAAHDQTVGAGLLKAALQVALEGRPVGLVLYDLPLPEPLDAKRPLGLALGAGLAFSPEPGPATLASLELSVGEGAASAAERPVSRALLASGNPVARILPLLERVAAGAPGELRVALHGGGALHLRVEPR